MTKHGTLLILLIAVALLASEVVWAGGGYRLWLGLGLIVALVIARGAHVFTTT
jgi:hypothetical protein